MQGIMHALIVNILCMVFKILGQYQLLSSSANQLRYAICTWLQTEAGKLYKKGCNSSNLSHVNLICQKMPGVCYLKDKNHEPEFLHELLPLTLMAKS